MHIHVANKDGINFEIDESNLTAKVVQSIRTMSNVTIPRFINYFIKFLTFQKFPKIHLKKTI